MWTSTVFCASWWRLVIVAVVAAFAQWLLSVCNNRITFSVSRDLRNVRAP